MAGALKPGEPMPRRPSAASAPAALVLRRGFAVVALVFGLAYVAVTPPFGAPDEYNHFFRAYHVSEGGVLARRESIALEGKAYAMVGAPLPASLVQMAELAPRAEPTPATGPVSTRARVATMRALPLRADEQIFTDFRNTALYAPVSYVPQGLGMLVARPFAASPVVPFYAGRLANLAFFAIVVALAMRIAPIHSSVLFLAAASPMALFVAASLSADAVLNAVCLVYVALVFSIALVDRRVRGLEIGGLVALPVAIALSKHAYAPLCLLALMIPAERFGGRRWRLAVIGVGTAAALLAAAAWTVAASPLLEPIPGHVSAYPDLREARTRLVLGDPFGFLEKLLRTLRVHGPRYALQLVGVLGWLEVPLPASILYAYLLALVAAAIADGASVTLALRQRAVVAATTAATVVTIFAALYLVWGSPSENVLEGVQGRYFVPLVPLGFAVLHGRRFRLGAREAWGLIALATCANIAGLLALLRRHPY
jgi:hypothetical protein